MPLFEYAIIQTDRDGKESLVAQPTSILAVDVAQAKTLADRAIPQSIIDSGELSNVKVVVRPFA